MQLYAICLVKNEDDIISQTLTYAARHCDRIFVIDNGSTDRTWEITQELAREYPQIVPFLQTREPYHDALRALAYEAHHEALTDEDWWLILDGDEFLAEDPRPIIQEAKREGADIVKAWQIQFYYTDKDYSQWLAGSDNRHLTIFKRRRYYLINWQEPRLFRNQKAVAWDTRLSAKIPNGLQKVARKRILNRHYQYRDPEQIDKRLKLRYGQALFAAHVSSPDWQSAIKSSNGLCYYRDGDSWRFTIGGLIYYYRRQLQHRFTGKWRALRRQWAAFAGPRQP
jgi:glycosyltransferase involved in cell wall biosynthesis